MSDIGFIGLGNMGGPMARNLVQMGHKVTGFDLSSAALEAAVGEGIEAAGSIDEAARGRELVVTMLPAGEHSRAVYLGEAGLGEDGVIATAGAGTLLIDCSTIDVASARALHKAAADAGLEMLDAPVSGGVAGAAAASLTFMVGGSEPAFARAKDYLKGMGKTIVHAGESGNGQVAKMCNNLILAITMIGISEAFNLGDKLGLDARKLFEISSKATGSCWAMLNHLPVPGIVETAAANREFQPGFSAAMMHKDLKLSQEAAAQVGAATPLGAEATALYTRFIEAGGAKLDYSGIIKMIQSS